MAQKEMTRKESILKGIKRWRLVFGVLLVISFPFTISWFHNLSSYVIWGFGFLSMIQIALEPKRLHRLKSKELWMLTALFLWTLIGMTYSDNQADGWHYIEKQLSMLIFPFFFVFGGGFIPKERKVILDWFLIGLAGCLVLAVSVALFKNYSLDGLKYFHVIFYTYHNLSSNIGISAIYLSLYVGFALLILIDRLVNPDPFSQSPKYLVTCGILFFLGTMVLLAVKMVFAALVITLLILSFLVGRIKLGIIVIISFLILIGLFYSSISQYGPMKERLAINGFSSDQIDWSKDPENKSSYWNSFNMRAGLWLGAQEGIFNNFFFGPGTGDSNDLFMEDLRKMGFEFAVNNGFNQHNQYLGVWHRSGIVGMMLFSLIFGMGAGASVLKKDLLFKLFLLMTALCFITENYLEAQKGAIFFGFFFSFFFFSPPFHKPKQDY